MVLITKLVCKINSFARMLAGGQAPFFALDWFVCGDGVARLKFMAVVFGLGI